MDPLKSLHSLDPAIAHWNTLVWEIFGNNNNNNFSAVCCFIEILCIYCRQYLIFIIRVNIIVDIYALLL